MKMGKAGLAKWIKAYGFGKPTGIEFPGESGGIVAPVDQWSDSSIGNIPMGQGIAVTAIQMAVGLLRRRQQRLGGEAAAGRAGRRPRSTTRSSRSTA